MKYLTMEQAQKTIRNDMVFNRGELIVKQGKVLSLSAGEWKLAGFYPSIELWAKVKGSHFEQYEVTVKYTENSVDLKCNCMAYENYFSNCKHCAAVLIAMTYMDRPIKPDLYTSKIMDLIEKEARSKSYKEEEAAEPLYRMECSYNTLEFDDLSPLELKIGTVGKRMYLVKNVGELIDAIENKTEMNYGKELSFVPLYEEFDEKSQRLIDFIREVYYNYIDYKTNDVSVKYNDLRYKVKMASVIFTKVQFDQFFDLVKDDMVNISQQWSAMTDDMPFVVGNPPLGFVLKKEGDGASLSVRKSFGLIKTRHYYSWYKDRIYRLEREFGEKFSKIYDIIQYANNKTILVNKDQLPKFVSLVVSTLRELGLVKIDPEYEKEFELIPLTARAYIDINEGVITARTEYWYEEDMFTALNSHTNANRDFRKEYMIENMFADAMFRMNGGTYVLIDENDNFYNFVREFIPILTNLCELYMSDEFKKVNIRTPSVMSAGVRIKGNLLELDMDFADFEPNEISDILNAYKLKKKYFKLRDGSYLDIGNEQMGALNDFFEELDINASEIEDGTITLPKYRAMYLDRAAKNRTFMEIDADVSFLSLARDIKMSGDISIEIPQEMKKILRSYQKSGYRWMKTLAHYGLCGILADDMGLGKTLQVIAMIQSDMGQGTSLAVVPTSLVYNWMNEIKKFAPQIKALAISGSIAERKKEIETISDYDIVITSYDMLKRDIERYEEIEFLYCIVDEAQNIKNFNTQNAKAVKTVKSKHRLAMTGTPIENSLSELWSIFDFLMPGYFGSYKKFKDKYEIPIIKHKSVKKSKELLEHVSPFLLRRLKKDVLKELPDKIESVMENDMTEEQRTLYNAYYSKAKQELAIIAKQSSINKSSIQVLSLITRLRQICCHPSMFVEDYEGGSGKLDQTMEIIKDSVESGHRILLFSQFTQMLSILKENLENEKIEYFYLDGSTPSMSRVEMVDNFNGGEKSIFLISLKAGGSGLNLVGADIVIHYDQWWNPAVENQATDRAYRIGQEKNVQVFKLITKNSIEEKIQELKQKKQDLTDSVIKSGEIFVNNLTAEELEKLFE